VKLFWLQQLQEEQVSLKLFIFSKKKKKKKKKLKLIVLGQIAVQLAKLAGNYVIGTCSSDEKVAMLKVTNSI